MTVGVFESCAFIAIWVVTMVCLTVSYLHDLARWRRRQFHRRLQALGRAVNGTRPTHRGF